MNTNIELINGNWLLVVDSQRIVPTLLKITARLAETGPVRMVDGGFLYDPFLVNYFVRDRSEVLGRIKVSLADNCHEILSILESLPSSQEPFVVLDLLSMFFDPFVYIDERKRMLGLCLSHLDRLAKGSSGLVSVRLPYILSQTESDLLKMVKVAAKDTFHAEMVEPAPVPMRVI